MDSAVHEFFLGEDGLEEGLTVVKVEAVQVLCFDLLLRGDVGAV